MCPLTYTLDNIVQVQFQHRRMQVPETDPMFCINCSKTLVLYKKKNTLAVFNKTTEITRTTILWQLSQQTENQEVTESKLMKSTQQKIAVLKFQG